MHELADEEGVYFYTNVMIAPAIDGNPSPQKWMLNATQAAEMDWS